tara:strand:- start:86583 stop:87458 length:876 start_codon:yes stop_codon:yes gene_type:complete
MSIKRETFLKELELRENIQRAIRLVKNKKIQELNEQKQNEEQLRKLIHRTVKEQKLTDIESVYAFLFEQEEVDPDESPHHSTAINKLETLLKVIIDKLEDGYKALTTDPEQRVSYRAHIINGVVNALAVVDSRDETQKGIAEAVDVAVDGEPEDDESFIPVRDVDIKKLQDPDPEVEKAENFDIQGMDETGRDFALEAFDEIDSQIVNVYAKLRNPADKKEFKDYLITNLKIHFDIFEKELDAKLPEPTTPEYEKEKAKMSDMEADPVAMAEEDISLDLNEIKQWLKEQRE